MGYRAAIVFGQPQPARWPLPPPTDRSAARRISSRSIFRRNLPQESLNSGHSQWILYPGWGCFPKLNKKVNDNFNTVLSTFENSNIKKWSLGCGCSFDMSSREDKFIKIEASSTNEIGKDQINTNVSNSNHKNTFCLPRLRINLRFVSKITERNYKDIKSVVHKAFKRRKYRFQSREILYLKTKTLMMMKKPIPIGGIVLCTEDHILDMQSHLEVRLGKLRSDKYLPFQRQKLKYGAHRSIARSLHLGRAVDHSCAHHFVRKCLKNCNIQIEYSRSEEVPADIFTKPLSHGIHEKCYKDIGILKRMKNSFQRDGVEIGSTSDLQNCSLSHLSIIISITPLLTSYFSTLRSLIYTYPYNKIFSLLF